VKGNISLADIEKMVVGTKVVTLDDIESLVNDYRDSYWREKPDECERIFLQLYNDGKIIQPRLETPSRCPKISNHELWVENESEINWSRSF